MHVIADPGLAGDLHHLPGCLKIRGHGLLADHVFSVFCSQCGESGVGIHIGNDIDEVQFFIFHQGLGIVIGFWNSEAFTQFLRPGKGAVI